MTWSSLKKRSAFFGLFQQRLFCSKEIFLTLVFHLSVYSVLNKLSEYIYFYLSKNITSYTFPLVFKIVERLQYILKFKTFVFNKFNLILQVLHHFIILSRCFCILLCETMQVLPQAQRAISSANCDNLVVCVFPIVGCY